MVSRRNLLAGVGAGVGAGALVLLPSAPAGAADGRWTAGRSANGWPIDADRPATHRIEGTDASVALRGGSVVTVLLHVARRWHYEISPLDTGEGGGVAGWTADRVVGAPFESNQLSGTAVALHPAAYPLGGAERLWPHHELIVRDILLDCEGAVAWGGDLKPAKCSHFHIAVPPGDRLLARVAARLDPAGHGELRRRIAGATPDPAQPERRARALRLPRPRR